MIKEKIAALSAARPPTAAQMGAFSPTPAHEQIAGALNGQTSLSDAASLAEAAGVSVRTLQRACSDPAAVTWIVAQQTEIASARLGAVHGRLFEMAMTSRSATWAKLYLERFDGEYKKQKILEKGANQQFNFSDMTHAELLKSIGRAYRKLQGVTDTPGALEAEVPRDHRLDGEPGGVPAGNLVDVDAVVRDPDPPLHPGAD